MGLQTEFSFTLPKGYVGPDGTLHRQGTMRLATARDEIEPLRDPRIAGPEDPYLTVLVISRVVTQLGNLPAVGVAEIEGLFAADLAFLQDLYSLINFGNPADVPALQRSVLQHDTEAGAPAAPAAPEPAPDPSPALGLDDETPRRARGRIEEVGSRADS